MIKELYIMADSGLPLYHYSFISQINADETLFSGFITAIQSFMNEINIGSAKYFQTSDNDIYIRNVKKIAYVLIIDTQSDISRDKLDKLLDEIENKVGSELDIQNPKAPLNNNIIDKIVSKIVKDWTEHSNQSQPVQKLIDELW